MHARVRYGLLVAAASAAGVALLRWLAFRVPAAHRRDALALHDFMSLDRPLTHHLASVVAHMASPVEFGLIGATLVAIALLRGRPWLAAAAGAILLGSAITTDYILKPALAAPRFADVLAFHQIDAKAFPSGHATASMALALTAVLVVGPRLRPFVVGLGALFAIAVSYSLLSLGWHFPSDVIGGYLVAAGWTGLAVAALSLREARSPAVAVSPPLPKLDRASAVGLLVVVGLAAIAALIVLSPERTFEYVRDHKVFSAVAGAIAAAGVAVAGTVALMLGDRPD
jgi:membrane-associated phospholipid phosphatase